jgi:hypothetical protein
VEGHQDSRQEVLATEFKNLKNTQQPDLTNQGMTFKMKAVTAQPFPKLSN